MDGVWLEDGSFQLAPGAKGRFKGKGKGKENDAKRPRIEEPEVETEEEYFEREWNGKKVCLVNLQRADLNGATGTVKSYLGAEEILVEGKKKLQRRYLIDLGNEIGEKSIKFENLYKIMTGSIVRLKGLKTTELNEQTALCGDLDVKTMRYTVDLKDGKRIKVVPTNLEFVARYENVGASGSKDQVESVSIKSRNPIREAFAAIEAFRYPVPHVVPASVLARYAQKYPKSIVIGKSGAPNPKGTATIRREILSVLRMPSKARLCFISIPRDTCVGPQIDDMKHDDLLRLGRFAEWSSRRCAPCPLYFLLPAVAAVGPSALIDAVISAWPLYMHATSEVILCESPRWIASGWARLDAWMARWAGRPIYLLPEGYLPPIELQSSEDQLPENDNALAPFSFRPEESLDVNGSNLCRTCLVSGSAQIILAVEERVREGVEGEVLSVPLRRL